MDVEKTGKRKAKGKRGPYKKFVLQEQSCSFEPFQGNEDLSDSELMSETVMKLDTDTTEFSDMNQIDFPLPEKSSVCGEQPVPKSRDESQIEEV